MGAVTKLETRAAGKGFAEAFAALQAEIRPAVKDATNPAFRSKYADLAAVWEAIKEPLKNHGFSVIQSPDFEGESMWLKTIVLHESGESVEGRYPLRPTKQDPQGYGSALTYARRYSLSAMLGVVADIDDDGNEASGVKTNGAAPAKPAAPQDPDVADGVKNWCDRAKLSIDGFTIIGELLEWQEKNLGALDRLKRKDKPSFDDLMRHYRSKSDELSA